MNKVLKYFIITLLLAPVLGASAQDIHFSQFYNSPLTLNPALTGKVDGRFRVALNYRNQWFKVIDGYSPYVTYGGSFDAPIPVFKNDAIGVGAVVTSDNSGDGKFKDMSFLASAAYHKALGKNGRHALSLGVQLGYMQKQLDQNELMFFNQYNGTEFDATAGSGESIEDNSTGSFDFNIGLMWSSMIGKKLNIYAGGSVFHILEPEGTFLQNSTYKIPRRYLAHGGLEYRVAPAFAIIPSMVYMNQASASQINAGGSLGFFFGKDNEAAALYAGGYYRLDDSAIAYMGIEFKGFRIGASYDFTTSDLNNAPGATGSYELSLVYVNRPANLPQLKSLLFCPRF